SASDWERVDRLRAGSDAIMVGGHTLVGEDPRLTVKSPGLRAERVARGLPVNPAKVGVITRVKAPESGAATLGEHSRFITEGPARVLVFTTEQTEPGQVERLRRLGVEVYVAGERRVDLAEALRLLQVMGIERLMVEGGGTINADLLRLRLVDEIHLYVAPLIFGGASAPTLSEGEGLRHDEAIRLQLRDVQKLEDGAILLQYRVHKNMEGEIT
ncbi:MAG: dihydrofolate reductase family protein, partial [Chloroflexia bacterium]